MDVIVTGGAGFVGHHLARAHAEAGDRVAIVDSLAKSGGATDAELRALLDRPNVRLLTIDLANEVPRLDRVDVVYHLAAINGTRLFYEMPYELARINVRITLNLLEALAGAPPKRLVYTSSSEVYADADAIGALRIPTDETVPVVFTQPTQDRFSYGTSKFMGEFLCSHFGTRYGVPATTVRYHNVYGPRMGDKHVIPELIGRIAGGEDPLKVYGADEMRAFCYVDDAVEATRRVARVDPAPAIVHIGDPAGELRIGDLAERLMDIVGRRTEIVEGGRRSGSVARRSPDISLLRSLTGFEPAVALDEGLRRTVAWYRSRERAAKG